ncbi:hypothetical protein [Acidomonas methanolica]|uniref:hypothetical protein n=1 Tax=Acidomonas methanolica TaxID=437 RepID=UPI00211A473C|nr:hypothetical protein [Acidomonas methanolica]MCQ9156122.1 hypothetical protein [Acidomonas methanolica]
MTYNYDEIYLLQHSLIPLEEEYVELSRTWESYKVFLEKYYSIPKTDRTYLDISIDLITGALNRDAWSCMMRIWDQKDKNYNNINLCSFYNAATSMKYDKSVNIDEKLFFTSKKSIRTLYNNNIKTVKKIRHIRNNFLSHKNIGSAEEIIKSKDGRRLDLFYINHEEEESIHHSIEEFDNLYVQTEKIISSCHELFKRVLNTPYLQSARCNIIKGTNDLIEKILYEQKKG